MPVPWAAELAGLFRILVPVWEIVLRGTVVYAFLFVTFRFVIRRDVGAVGIADMLLIVLVADASQNAMSGTYTTVSEGLVLVATLIGWNFLLDWLAFRSTFIRRFVQPGALLLVSKGCLLRRNLRREFITEDELWAWLREQGIEQLSQVKAAYLEADGNFSVIRC